jgi:glycosyltransferase involved in cell wall biosynthesis
MQEASSALDPACSSSDSSEEFPNANVEAMACGVLCVATDIGDMSLLVGSMGLIVPACDPPAGAAGMRELLGRLDASPKDCRKAPRERVVSEFGVDRLVERTSDVLDALVAGWT